MHYWQLLEDKNIEDTDIFDKIIIDFTSFMMPHKNNSTKS